MNPVKIGLVGLRFGAGLASGRLLGTENEKYVRLTAVCDMKKELVEPFAEKHQLPAYTDLDEMLQSADIEAVMLITPPAGRAKLIRKCLRAGKHVLTTKPFELDPEEARSVLAEARERHLVVHLNSPAPHPSCDLAQIRLWQEKYDLGRPVSGLWETYAQYHEQADGTWFDDPVRCPAAPIFRLGIYGINELIAVFGKVRSVEVASGRIATGRPTPDNAQLLLRFENGALGSIYAALCINDGTLYPSALTLHLGNGTIRKTQVRAIGERDFTEVRMSLQTVVDGKLFREEVSLPAETRSGSYEFDRFCDAVRRGPSADEVDPETIVEGIRVIAMMAAREQAGAAAGN